LNSRLETRFDSRPLRRVDELANTRGELPRAADGRPELCSPRNFGRTAALLVVGATTIAGGAAALVSGIGALMAGRAGALVAGRAGAATVAARRAAGAAGRRLGRRRWEIGGREARSDSLHDTSRKACGSSQQPLKD